MLALNSTAHTNQTENAVGGAAAAVVRLWRDLLQPVLLRAAARSATALHYAFVRRW